MLNAYLTGFILGLSLILAIGAQHSFVLSQGLMGRHVFDVALFCSLSDALLILLIVPTRFRGSLTILECSAKAWRTDCLIHQTA